MHSVEEQKRDLQISLLFSNQSKSDEKDFLKPFQELQNQASLGDTSSQFLVGMGYRFGIKGCALNIPESNKWMMLAAKNENSPAGLCAKGLCFQFGIGEVLIKNKDKAKDYYLQSLAKGYIPAGELIATLLYWDESLNISEVNSTYSGYNDTYSGHTKVKHIDLKKRQEAVKLWTEAAEQGYSRAQECLGYCYLHGWGVEKDLKQAFRLYQLSADAGDAEGRYFIGTMYEKGLGVFLNVFKAEEYFKLAASQGHKQAIEAVKRNAACCVIL